MLDRDEPAFLSTIDKGDVGFLVRQRRLFHAMRDVPFSDYQLEAAWDRFGDLARPSDVEKYKDADEVFIPVTEEHYKIADYDPESAAEDLFYTFVKRNGEWLIAEDTDLDDFTFYTARHLWDSGPLYTDKSDHFLLFAHPCSAQVTQGCLAVGSDFLSLAEAGLATLERYWTAPWQDKVVVLVPGSIDELERMIQSTFDLDNFVAFAYSTIDLDHGFDYTGNRIIPNPNEFQGRAGSSVQEILTHELLHVATRASSGPFIPIFVEEGFADYVGHDADPGALAFFNNDVASGLFDGRLPEDYQFTVGSGTDIYRSYQKSHSAVRFFIGTYGLEAFQRFYRSLGHVEIAAGTVRYHLERALRRTTGLDLDGFQDAWASSIR
ncbi:MAG: hypothetical protein QOG54_1870 [Actinomycetota bacterium]|nr:hypothetical protein [Actinomycetota bacterium]